MILVIPSLDLRNGECCQCIKGAEGTQEYYNRLSKNPEDLILLWRKENSKSLHITDLDSFEDENNYVNANSVLYLSQIIDIPIQFYSNFTDTDECDMFLSNGVYRVIIDSLFENQSKQISELIQKHTPSRVVFLASSKNGIIEIPGKGRIYSEEDFFEFTKNLGGNRIVYDYLDDDNNLPKKLEELTELSKKYNVRVTLKNSIYDSKQLLYLCNYERKGIDSVILGKALYENNFPCQKIWREVEADLDCCNLNSFS